MKFKVLSNHIICSKPVNSLVRFSAPLIKFLLSPDQASRIPIVGEVALNIDSTIHCSLFTDGNDRVASRIFWAGPHGYDWATLRIFIHLCKRSAVALDIGANTGIFSLAAAAMRSLRVFAIEPVPEIFECLRVNGERNGFDNLVAINAAIGERDGTIELVVPADFNTYPLTSSAVVEYAGPSKRLLIDCLTVDAIVSRYRLSSLDIMKLDVEGMEDKALIGAAKSIERLRPFMIIEVWPGAAGTRIEDIIRRYDYCYYWITDDGLKPSTKIIGDSRYKDSNYLCAPREKIDIVQELVFAIQNDSKTIIPT